MTAMKTWYAELAADVIRRRRIFAQIGSFHRTTAFDDDILGALVDAGLRPLTCSVDRLSRELDTTDFGPDVVIVVPDFDSALRFARPEIHLRQCRPVLQKTGEAGAAWLIISRAPESRFPLVDGSSVTIDSARHRIRYLSDEKLTGLPGLAATDTEVIAKFAGGSRAIASALSGLATSGIPRRQQIAEARRSTMEVLTNALSELGPELLAWLERWVFENSVLHVSTTDVRNDALQELRAAGVAEIDPVDDCVDIFAPPHTSAWRKALAAALSNVLEAPARWESVVADLFFIERFLRRALAALLEDRYGRNWRTRLPDDMQIRVIESFQRDASARSREIADVERPLDWITLGDLFELIPRFSGSERLAGLSVTDWRIIADNILPVRNRVSHMRLLRDDDRQAVRNARWRITNAPDS